MLKRLSVLAVICVSAVGVASSGAGAAAIATFDLSTPVVTATSASMDVSMTLSSDPFDYLDSLVLSIHDSDLTSGNTNFNRYGFTPDTVTFLDWLVEYDVGVEGYEVFSPDFVGSPVPLFEGIAYRLGELTVNLAGVGPDTSVTVGLDGGDLSLGTNTDAAGYVGVDYVMSFAEDTGPNDNAFIEFGSGHPATFRTLGESPGVEIPEPFTLGTFVLALGAAALVRRRRRA